MIKLVSIDKIINHPENPRRDLGDLTELADSIKENGVLQNLTIVPMEVVQDYVGAPEYYALIGNRRLAASKLAGLREVPCSIVEMDKKTQIGTMLLENMQRVDLTIYEQAQGFQMMLDLGEDLVSISDKTGFSETTVRRRVKLLELDKKKFKEGTSRGATLMEYMELFEIKDPGLRNEVLESIGTENFNWNLNRAKDKEKRKEWEIEITSQLDKFAVKVEEVGENFSCKAYYNDTASSWDLDKPEDAGTREYVYQVSDYGQIRLYAKDEELGEEEVKKEEDKKAEKSAIEARVKEIKERSKKLREDFIHSKVSESKLKKYMGDLLILTATTRTSFYMWDSDYINSFKLEVKTEDFSFETIEEEMKKKPALSLLKIIYNESLKNRSYFDYSNGYCESEALDRLYEILTKVGFEMSEEEKQLQDGSHQIFKDAQEV